MLNYLYIRYNTFMIKKYTNIKNDLNEPDIQAINLKQIIYTFNLPN